MMISSSMSEPLSVNTAHFAGEEEADGLMVNGEEISPGLPGRSKGTDLFFY